MPETTLNNIALLIDADNTTPEGIDPVLTVMAELGQVNIRRAYGNFAKDNLSRWDKITNKFGIRPQQQFDVTRGKNATDMAMTIDAIDLLYQGKMDGFGIMTSDSDFTPLVTRLRQDGIVVYGFGEAKTPLAFQSVCTRFIDIKKLIATNEKRSRERAQEGPEYRLGRSRRRSARTDHRRIFRGQEPWRVRKAFTGRPDCGQPVQLRCAKLRLQKSQRHVRKL